MVFELCFLNLLVLETRLKKMVICQFLQLINKLIKSFKLKSPFEQQQQRRSRMGKPAAPGKQKQGGLILKNCFH